MVTGEKRLGLESPVAGIDSGIAGAPAGVAGSGDGRDSSSMTGRPVAAAGAAAAVDAGLPGVGTDRYMSVGGDGGARPVEKDDTEGHDGPGASTDTEQPAAEEASAAESSAAESSAVKYKEVAEESAGAPDMDQLRADAVAGTDRQIRTIQDWMEAEDIRPETKEEREKRERREKSKRIIAAVSDGISALSNLYFTSQYAPDMYKHEKGMSNAVGAHLDRLKAEREKKRDQYLNFSLKLGDLQNQRAATLRELEAQQEARKLAREKAKRDAEKHDWEKSVQPEKEREQKGKADLAGHKAAAAKVEADWANEYYGNRAALEGEKINTEKSKQNNYNRPKGGRSGGGSGGSGQTWLAVDDDGNRHTITAKSKGHAQNLADGNGWTLAGFVGTSESTNRYGEKTTRVQSQVGITQGGKTARSNGKKKNRLGL